LLEKVKRKEVIVTLTTDASYHSQHKVGAYAFWITSDLGRVKASGILKQPVRSACEAEMQCILNALHVMKKAIAGRVEKVIVNTDSLNSIRVFENDKENIKKYNLNWARRYRTFLLCLDVPIEFRHVKAHKTTKDARSWVNNWCDTAAKKHLWEKINRELRIGDKN
jgi:ribonuclease HI